MAYLCKYNNNKKKNIIQKLNHTHKSENKQTMAERKRYCVTYFKLWGAAQVYNTTNDKDIAMDWVDSANWDSHMAVDRDTGEVIHWYIKGGSNISF